MLGEGEIPDAILVDLEMPEISGADFCKRIRAQENTKHIPVYLVTIKKENEVADIIRFGTFPFVSRFEIDSQLLEHFPEVFENM